MMNNMYEIAYTLNLAYSRLWIAVTGLSKYEYRDYSLIHKLLVGVMFAATSKEA